MKGNLFFCSGYRAIQWNPTMTHFNPMKLHDSSTKEIIKMAAVLAYFTAQSISLRSESSKLLLLTPHNDTVADLEAMLGAPETDYPPTLYDFFLTCIYRKYYLSHNLNHFPTYVRGELQPAVEQNVDPKRIHEYIEQHPEIKPALVQRCSLPEIVECCLLYTRGFATYCTISNTVKTIGIGGAASLFISIKMSDFLSSSPEADARNLVALTRSKGLSLLVLPTTTKYFDSALHSITTQCSVRHGLFTIQRFADFLVQADTMHNGVGDVFNAASWMHTHQITRFGKWDVMPFSLALAINSQVSYFHLSLRHNLPKPNTSEITASSYEWQGSFPGPPSQPAAIVFGDNCLALVVNDILYATFPYPELGSSTVLKSTIFSLAPASGAHFFRRPSHGVGHNHPLKATTDADSPIGLPFKFLMWPATSPATFTPGKSGDTTPVCPSILSQDAQTLFHQGLPFLLSRACMDDPTLPPAAWLAAYGALTTSNFQQAHLNALTASSILEEFTDEVVTPILNNEDPDSIRLYVESILNSTHVPWTTILPHRQPPPNDSPPEDDLVVVLARRKYSALKHWVDDLPQKFHHLLHILANATDLARSPHGWVFLRSLKRYSGRAVPGNWDAHTDTILHTNTFSLSSSGQPLPLDRNLLCAMVAFDDNRRRYRFTLGDGNHQVMAVANRDFSPNDLCRDGWHAQIVS